MDTRIVAFRLQMIEPAKKLCLEKCYLETGMEIIYSILEITSFEFL